MLDHDYWWCLHCEQAFLWDSLKNGTDPKFCPVCGDGSGPDLRDWDSMSEIFEHWPEEPELGVCYQLDGAIVEKR